MEENEITSGIFYNMEGTINIKINNIVDNIPNGFITISISNDKYNLLFEDLDINDKININDNNFVNDLCTFHLVLIL